LKQLKGHDLLRRCENVANATFPASSGMGLVVPGPGDALGRQFAEVIDIQSDRDSPQRAPERQVERDRRAAHERRAAWTKGYLHGLGKPKIALALARKRSLEKIRDRRTAQNVARALGRGTRG
jgi:hypothetical protein